MTESPRPPTAPGLQPFGQLPRGIHAGGEDLTDAAGDGFADHRLRHAVAVDADVELFVDVLRGEIRKRLAAGFRHPEAHQRPAVAGVVGALRFGDLERQRFCEGGTDDSNRMKSKLAAVDRMGRLLLENSSPGI